MPRFRLSLIASALIATALASVGLSVYAANRLLQASAHGAMAATCQTIYAVHTVTIYGDKPAPDRIQAHRCDELVIVNADDVLRLMAFGRHDEHQAYDGVTERALSKGQRFTVVLNKTGTYEFHDHVHDTVIGYFTVTAD